MQNRTIARLPLLLALVVFWVGFPSRAEAAWPKTGDVLVVTRSFDPTTATFFPYVIAVDPVTRDKTVIADLSTFTDAEIFNAGRPIVPVAVAESRDGIIWLAYRNSFAAYSSSVSGPCTQCGGVVVRINPDGSHSVVRLGWGLYPTGLASAPDGSVVMVTGPFGNPTGPDANHQLYRIRALDAVTSTVEGFQVPRTTTNPSCAAPITIAYLGQDASGNVSPPGQPGERYAFLDISRNPIQAAIDAGISEVTDATGGPVPIQTYIDATGQPAAHIDDTGYVVIGDVCDYDLDVFASAVGVTVDQTTGTDIYVGDILGGTYKRSGDTVPFCQQFGYPGCGALQHVVVTDPSTLTANKPIVVSDFGDPNKGTPIGAEAGGGVAIFGTRFLVTDDDWYVGHDLENASNSPCLTSPNLCNVNGALFVVNPDGTRTLLSAFGYASAYGGTQGDSGNTGLHTLPVVVTLDGAILIGDCDGSNGLNSADSICQVDDPTSATPGFRTLWSDFGGMLGGRQLVGVVAMAVAPPTTLRTPTTTTLASSLNPSTYGQSVMLTATVSASGGTPTGQVTFYDGAIPIATSALDPSGTATASIDTLMVGSHSITAAYGGDSAFAKSTSSAVSQVVGQANTTTSLSSSLNPAPVGTAITITASVAPQYGGQPTGTVTFREGATVLQTVALGPTGAAITLNAPAAGLHELTATYDGDSNFLSSASTTLNQIVGDAADVAVTVTSAPASPAIGSNVTFTVDLHNNGPQPVTSVVVHFGQSGNLAIVSASSGSFDPVTGLWTVGPLAAGGTSELQVVATLTDYAAAVRIEIQSASLPDPDLSNNLAVLVLQPAGVIYVDALCTLRQAIVAANTDAPFGGCPAGAPGPDVIVLPPASSHLYSDVYEAGPTSNGDDALPAVTSPIRLEGRGSTVGRTTGAAVPEMRIFLVKKGGALTLHQVSVENGTVGGPGAGVLLEGAGGSLIVDASRVVRNTSRASGGGIASRASGSSDDGDITVRNGSLVAENAADGFGGGISAGGSLTVLDSTVGGGTAGGVDYAGNIANLAGGVYIGAAGSATMTNTGILRNVAQSAGGIANDGTLHMNTSTIANNSATGSAGSLAGGLATGVTGSSDVAGTFIFANAATAEAGAIWNGRVTTLTDTYVTGNFAPNGSGIENTGVMTITRGSVSGNTFPAGTTPGVGGGVLNLLTNNVGAAAQLVMADTIMQANASGSGGAIATYGPASLTNLTVGGTSDAQGNVAAKAGGGILVSAGGQPGASGIAAVPSLLMTGGTLSKNIANGDFFNDGGGGAIANGSGAGLGGQVTLVDVTVAGNGAPNGGEGGGVFNRSTLTVTRGTMTGNSAGSTGTGGSGGAIANGSGGFPGGTVTVNGTTFSSNTAAVYGGAISSRGTLIVTGGSMDTNTAENGGAIGNVQEGSATLTGVSMDSNSATSLGGQVYSDGPSLTVDGGTITNGTAKAGGGIYAASDLSVKNGAQISNNAATGPFGATGGGGGIRITGGTYDVSDAAVNSNQSTQTVGGGVFVSGAQGSITRSVMTSNYATNGGAIALLSTAPATSTTLELTRSTLSGNGAFEVAGVWLATASTATIGNTTISGNSGSALATVASDASASLSTSTVVSNGPSAGGGVQTTGGSVSIDNSIVAGNFTPTTGVDCNGSVGSNGYNLFGVGGGCPVTGAGDLTVNPGDLFATVLGPLRDNGGPTMTHALVPGSPAIDHGNPAASGASVCSATDQRGLPRPADGNGDGVARCDIGAFEQQTASGGGPGPATHFALSAPATAAAGTPITLTVTALDASDVTATAYAGTVHFTSTDAGATLPADTTLSNGAGTFSVTLQTAGSQTITATDASAITGTSNGITVTVPAVLPPAIAKAFGPSAIEAGQVSTLTFTLSNPNAGRALSGVAFTDPLPAGVVVADTPNVSNTCGGTASAVASAASVSLTAGSLAAAGTCQLLVDVTAVSTGAKDNVTGSVTSAEGGTGNTATATLTVTARTTVTTLASSLNPSIVGQAVTLTATVTGFNPGGTVTFMDGATVLGSATVAGGSAALNVSTLSQGMHAITASYSGDVSNLSSGSTPLSQVVNPPPAKTATTTTLTSSSAPSAVGQPVTLTATVIGSSPTGTVTFADGKKMLGTATLVNGVAALTVTTLGKGSHQITATYNGDDANLPSTSSKLKQQVK